MSFNFKIAKKLTKPIIKLVEGEENFIKIIGDPVTKPSIDEKKGEITICDVVDLLTGEDSQIIMPAVMRSIFKENYNGAIKDKCFRIVAKGKKKGKGSSEYNTYIIDEIVPE